MLAGALVTLAPASSLAGGPGLRTVQPVHRMHSGRVHVSHGVEVWRGSRLGSARPDALAKRPAGHHLRRGVWDPAPHPRFHEHPLVIFVDDGPEIVIEDPGVVIIID
jgi:hypothetical protein